VTAVDSVSFSLGKGEFVGLVGESGSGKSTVGYAIAGLQKPPARTATGRALFDGTDITSLSREQLRRQRHGGIAMVLQSGMNALNPVRRIRDHFVDIYRAHGHVGRDQWRRRSEELCAKVKLPASVLDSYPGELSGGMRQRASIALALSLEPSMMVFDEPTTALDVLVQHAVMETITELQQEEGFTAILISHDLGIVLEATQRVLVMHDGRIVEDAPSKQILRSPQDEYTKMLLSHYADPRAEEVHLPGLRERRHGADAEQTSDDSPSTDADAPAAREPIVLSDVSKIYPARRRGEQKVVAVDHVDLRLDPGQAVALVGQSGSGKSTIAKLITGVEKPTSGTVSFGDQRVDELPRRRLKELHQEVQMVFQDPYAALNPLHTVEYTLSRPIINYSGLSGNAVNARVLELLDLVGLTPADEYAQRRPHELSGGQRQRVVIARALACDPQVLVADEPVSMLDVSLRAGILALLEDLRERLGLSLLYITHDLLSARVVTDWILVLHDGKVVEAGPTQKVLRFPEDEYTITLLDSIPNPAAAHDAAPDPQED
jgi:peptide/nickel transport system ATP-binding protein